MPGCRLTYAWGLGLMGCVPATTPSSPPAVVVLLVDGLRPDRIGVGPDGIDRTPHLSAWAAGATRFTQARAPSSGTVPSVGSLLSGHRPDPFQPSDHLAHRVQAAGWTTALLASNLFLAEPFGLTGGFSIAEHREREGADIQLSRATELLSNRTSPTLLVVQLTDVLLPHTLESPPPPTERLGHLPEALMLRAAFSVEAPTAAEQAYLSDRYDARVEAVDLAFGEFIQDVDSETTLVVTAPHGFGLGERGSVGHGYHLTEEQVRVPLVVGGPGWPAAEVTLAVDLADVGTTLAALAGVSLDPSAIGRSLHPAQSGEWQTRPTVLGPTLYGPARVGLVDGKQKWISATGETWTIDLAADPLEQTPERSPDWTGAFRTAWAEATGVQARRALHLQLQPGTPTDEPLTWHGPTYVQVAHPAGVVDVWSPPAPIHAVPWQVTGAGTSVDVQAMAGRLPRELWVELATPADLRGLTVSADIGGQKYAETWQPPSDTRRVVGGVLALTVGPADAQVTVTPGWAPRLPAAPVSK